MAKSEITVTIESALQDIIQMKGEVQGIFDPQLKSVDSTIYSYQNKADKCPNSIDALNNTIRLIGVYGDRYDKTNNFNIQDIDTKIYDEQQTNSQMETLIQLKKHQINEITDEIDKISADLNTNLINQEEYKKKLEEYKQKLQVSKQQLQECLTRGFSKKQQIFLIIILVVISIVITLLIKREFKKKSQRIII